MDKAKRIDRLKNLAIALLIASALWLLYKAVFYETASTAAVADSGEQTQEQSGQSVVSFSAKPACVLVTGLDGTHTAARVDRDAREKLLAQFSASLGEALGSAGEPKAVDAAEWHNALGATGVFFDYLYPQPLSLIASALGTTPKGGAAGARARRLFLSVADGAVRLYYVSAADGGVYRCTTALSASSLSAKLGDYRGGTAKFAFEAGEEYASLDPCFIFSGETASLSALSAADPLPESGEVTRLFDAFGMSSRAASGYIEKGGSVVYVEGEKSLRVDSSGSILFTVANGSGASIAHSGELTDAAVVSACASIAESSVGGSAGVAELVLSACETDSATGETDLSFSYAVGGIPVMLADGSPAATFKIRDGSIVRAELCFRKYSYTGETLGFLPEKQAAAIVKAGGGEPVLVYNDKGDGVTASWIVQ